MIKVESEVADDFMIRTDRKALLTILSELLENATRFAPYGDIIIGCREQDQNKIVFSVSDNGPGIAPEDRDRIFAQFTKLNSFTEGIGLGLSLCQNTARMLGGDLTLDDHYTQGARFVITLPIG